MKKFPLILFALAGIFTGCSTMQTPDARVTLAEPYVLTESGLVQQADIEPGTYAQNQIIEAGDYLRAELEALAPIPPGAQIQPGTSPSQMEMTLNALSGVAGTIPGGQPVGALLLGAAGLAKIWRDQKHIKDVSKVARTLAAARDSSLDVIATLPDKDQARRLEEQINAHTEHFAKSLGKARDLLDTIMRETETPTKKGFA